MDEGATPLPATRHRDSHTEPFDVGLSYFGGLLAARDDSLWLGDVNADNRDDLVVGSDEGVAVLHGHADGLHPGLLPTQAQPGKDTRWPGVADDPRRPEGMGPAVSGDLTGDGYVDLALISDFDESISIVIGTSRGLGSDIAQGSPPQWAPGGWGEPQPSTSFR